MFIILSKVIHFLSPTKSNGMFFNSLESSISRENATEFVQFVANHMQDTRIVNTGKSLALIMSI